MRYFYGHPLLVVLLLVLFTIVPLSAQKSPLKFGKISSDEWDLQEVPYDQEAAAVVLYHYATAKFTGNNLSVTFHKRIKVLKPKAIDLADVEIPFYSKDGIQKVVSLKAQSHNSDGENQSLSNKDFYTSQHSEEWSRVSFSFPNVAVGTILEYSYTLISENFVFLRTWDFQDDYPTLHSEFRAAIPEALNYKVIFQGKRLLQKYGSRPESQWVLNNLDALKPEPFMTTINDFRERIRFQLTGYYTSDDSGTGGIEFKSLMTSWKSVGQELWTNQYFGDQINKKGIAKSITENALSLSGDQKSKLQAIYAYVSQNYRWDGDYSTFASPLKDVVEKREGDSGDINLLLCMLLNYHEIDAQPVLISTRGHGMVAKDIALLSQFNHVVVRVKIGEEYFLMNATDPLRPYNLLAEEDLNKFGLVVPPKQEPHWIDLQPAKNNVKNFMISMDLTDLSNPEVSVQGSYNGLYATNIRRKIKSEKADLIPTKAPEMKLQIEAKNEDEILKPLILKSSNIDLEIMENGPYLYVEPMFLDFYPENPFKAEKRNFPIDFGSPFKESYSIKIIVPDGYIVEEVPEATSLKLPRNYGYFQYFTDVNPQEITLTARMGINKPTMGYGMYPSLQQFYDLMIEKLNAQVVLKKN